MRARQWVAAALGLIAAGAAGCRSPGHPSKDAADAEALALRVATRAADNDWGLALDLCWYAGERYQTYRDIREACDGVFDVGIPRLIAQGQVDRILASCRYGDDLRRVSRRFAKACDRAAGHALDAGKARVIAARDRGEDDVVACLELEATAEAVGGDATGEVARLCREMEAAAERREAAEEAAATEEAAAAAIDGKSE